MDYNIVTLEIADLLIHFDYYDQLITGNPEEQVKMRNKRQEHLANFFNTEALQTGAYLNRPLSEWKELIASRLPGFKNGEIHELVEKLEKDVKKMKKLYKAQRD
ncbi:hypothetical protein HQ865_13655 [Mucilaginibacter mali]|uniref:Uncharacterized protein n=1 Tax=Mucilaginibacter mali TaxID=2740462 RepID=A0A7D4TN97_9SPHI|nr:hypothetical protein [Mucilaginibacter mali]QKJ30753.1 hypothetical protein HQ865_13655 [Mucilaginibacter mali]